MNIKLITLSLISALSLNVSGGNELSRKHDRAHGPRVNNYLESFGAYSAACSKRTEFRSLID